MTFPEPERTAHPENPRPWEASPTLTADEAREYQKMPPCIHCGGWHLRACPRVKKATFNGDGKPVEVEYWPHGQWPDDSIVWPETVAEALADD